MISNDNFSQGVEIKVIDGDLGSAQFQLTAEYDQQIADFQLDTGSTYTSVSYTEFNSKYPVSNTMRRASASGVEKLEDKIVVKQFSLGSIVKSQFEVVRYKVGSPHNNRLGMNVFGNSRLKFDLKKWHLYFDTVLPETLKKHPLYLYVGNTYGIEVDIKGQNLFALWDTGAELSVVDNNFVSTHPSYFKFIQKIDNGIDATGEKVEFDLYEVADLKIGDVIFNGTVMSMDFHMIKGKVDKNIEMILGTNLIRNHIWHFDLSNKHWCLEI